MRTLTLALIGWLGGSAAFASGDALVIGNSTYNGVQTLFGATELVAAADALRAQGFDVAEARDADARSMDIAFENFVASLDDDGGPVVVILAGSFLHGANGGYLLPAPDGAALPDAVVLVEAFPVDAVLSVLAQFPGRAHLLVGESAVDAVSGAILDAGLGDLELPSGVTVFRGSETTLSRFAAVEFAKPGVKVIEAAEKAGVTVDGFTPRNLTVVDEQVAAAAPIVTAPAAPEPAVEPEPVVAPVAAAVEEVAAAPAAPETPAAPVVTETTAAVVETAAATPAPAPAPAPAPETPTVTEAATTDTTESATTVTAAVVSEDAEPEDTRSEVEIAADNAAWRAARIENSEASYTAYLGAQPEGAFANAARQRIKAIQSDPFYELRRAEDFLGLDREARRDIQRDLDVLDLYHWGVDGIFGDGTRDAIRAWQGQAGLQETGYLDLEQIAKLDADATAKTKEEEAAEARRQAAAAEAARREREAAAAAAAAAAEAAERRAGPSDSALWQEVERLGTEAAVRRYLATFPNGTRSRQARQMLQVIERMRGG